MEMAEALSRGATSTPLLEETIGANLARTVAAHGDREAIVSVHQSIRWTYREFADRVETLARGLLALGLEPGDRLGVWSPNYAEWTLLQYATADVGVVLVNINPAYRTHELAYVLEHSGCRALVAAPAFKTSNYVEMVEAVRPEVPGLEHVIFLWSPEWERLNDDSAVASRDALEQRRATLAPNDAINIQYTSGTTGFPKGATLTHRNILNNGFFTGELQRFTPEDRLCIPVPFYHCFGMVLGNLGCTTHGATMVIPADSYDPAAVLQAVQDERCTALYGVPTMFVGELALDDFDRFDLSSLRTGVMAGSPCPVEVMKACIDRMHMEEVTICYGMTETSPVSTQTLPEDSLHHRTATVGRVHPHVEVRVASVDDPDRTVAPGEIGELCTRGYSVMIGYWEDPEQTTAAIDADGWMHTGDLATMDGDGYLNIVGRSKDMVIRGGENVYPREVEEFLHGHPAVMDVQVVGVPDERFGEELLAAVRLQPGVDASEESLRDFCRGQIAHFKVPRYVTFVDEYPMTVTGKVQKYKLREQAIVDLGLESAASIETA